tara:strand:+ start:2848 stop:3447 length:600 start_codon:yes stop_codon:yes gene_type:complete
MNTVQNATYTPIKSVPYDIKIFSALAIVALVVRMIFAEVGKDYATATVSTYGFSLLALMGILASSFALNYKGDMKESSYTFFKKMISHAIPSLTLAIIIVAILVQNVVYFDKINEGKVAGEYFQFSGVSSFLILVQLGLVLKYMMDIMKGTSTNNNTDSSKLFSILANELFYIILIVTMLNLFMTGILQVILQFFSTDG